MRSVLILNETHPTASVEAGYCASFLCRLRGLMFRKGLGKREGLLLVQPRQDRMDAAIHMFFMAFDITAVWLDSDLKVVDVRYARRWRPAYMPKKAARYVLETHASRIDDFQIGDQLAIKPC
jgi:uncharacterized membrane protein (UPF0127 family)